MNAASTVGVYFEGVVTFGTAIVEVSKPKSGLEDDSPARLVLAEFCIQLVVDRVVERVFVRRIKFRKTVPHWPRNRSREAGLVGLNRKRDWASLGKREENS